jgi:hypothetical protein
MTGTIPGKELLKKAGGDRAREKQRGSRSSPSLSESPYIAKPSTKSMLSFLIGACERQGRKGEECKGDNQRQLETTKKQRA